MTQEITIPAEEVVQAFGYVWKLTPLNDVAEQGRLQLQIIASEYLARVKRPAAFVGALALLDKYYPDILGALERLYQGDEDVTDAITYDWLNVENWIQFAFAQMKQGKAADFERLWEAARRVNPQWEIEQTSTEQEGLTQTQSQTSAAPPPKRTRKAKAA